MISAKFHGIISFFRIKNGKCNRKYLTLQENVWELQ